jgi:hypothetical protein
MMVMFFFFGLEKPLEELHIVVDAGNGAGGFFVVMCYTFKVLSQCTFLALVSFVMLSIITFDQMVDQSIEILHTLLSAV